MKKNAIITALQPHIPHVSWFDPELGVTIRVQVGFLEILQETCRNMFL